MSGLDRTLIDKLSWFGIRGHWFALFGVANLLGYGAHLLMPKDWFYYHFAYSTYPARMFKPLKSMIGSDNFWNVLWTAPSLIGLNFYMNQRLGPLVMTKFFALSFASSFIFLSAFNPDSGLNVRPFKRFAPKFDSNADDGSYYMGADQMAQALIYFTLLYHRLWYVALPFMAFDVLYYGPSTIGGPAAAIVGALTFL